MNAGVEKTALRAVSLFGLAVCLAVALEAVPCALNCAEEIMSIW